MQANFTKQVTTSKGHIYFIRTQDEFERDAYYVLQVSSPKEQMFRNAMKGTAIVDYASFGAIIASGFGHTPSDDTVTMLKRDYDYEIP